MEAVAPPVLPGTWETLPTEVQTLILALQASVVELQTENAAVQAQCRELQARLGRLVRRGEAGRDRKVSRVVLFARPVVGGAVDACAGGGCRANEQRGRTRPTGGRAVA